TFVDGGIWANDPVALAVVEGISVLGWNRDELDVLSLGCTDEATDFKERWHAALFWGRKAVQVAIRGQSRSAQGMARHLTGKDKGLESVIRIDPTVAENGLKLINA